MEISMAYFKGPMTGILPNIGFAAEIYNVCSSLDYTNIEAVDIAVYSLSLF